MISTHGDVILRRGYIGGLTTSPCKKALFEAGFLEAVIPASVSKRRVLNHFVRVLSSFD
jgi:hypothetical protein